MDEYKNSLQRIQRLCSAKEYCKYDIREKLTKSELNEGDKEKLIQELVKQNFINEERYVEAFVHDKLFLSKWGTTKIRYALRQKGINAELFQELLKEIEEEKYIQAFTAIAKSKWKSIKDSDSYIRKQKLIRYLMGRGVEYEIAEKIYNLLK